MMLQRNILRGETVRLTALEQEDLTAIGRWYKDAGFARLFDATPAAPKSASQLTHWLDEVQKDKNGFLFAIRPVKEDTLLGYVELDGILWSQGNAWLALGLGQRDNWGKGYGTEAMQLALAFAFDELNLHRVQLSVFAYNERAIRLYEKLGFVREGTYREHLRRDGQFHDMYLYGLLRREWRGAAGIEDT
ncbi:MAG: GNAT family N-acetyltransferase [Candidatus Promineifilaceae bacterium]|jgi:RimJ/RimL family protein N-acetyltransferase